MASESLEVVSVTDDASGRVLSGVGADPDALRETMDRHAPEEPAETSPTVVNVTHARTDVPSETDQPKQTRGQKRYSELTSARDEAIAKAAAAEARAKELESKLAAGAVRPEPVAAPSTPVAAVQTPPAATRPKPLEEQVGAKYQTYADFVEDLADWKAEQRLAAVRAEQEREFDARIRKGIEADAASRSQSAKLDEVLSRGRKTYSDFDAVLQAPHMTATTWPSDKIQVIASLDQPEHIQYQLGKDPVLAERLRQEPNLAKFGMELAKLITSAAVAPLASTAPASFNIPAPIQPVGSGSKTTVPPSSELAKRGFDFDKSGYRERRAAERGVRRVK